MSAFFGGGWMRHGMRRKLDVRSSHANREGGYLEFKSDPGAVLVTKSLEDLRSKRIRLLNVRTVVEGGEETTFATVYVANDKKHHFLQPDS